MQGLHDKHQPSVLLNTIQILTQQFSWEFRNWEEERKKEGSEFCISMQRIQWMRVLMMQKESPFTFYTFPVLQPVCGFQSHRWLKSDAGVKKATLKFLLFLVLQFLLWNKTHIVSRAKEIICSKIRLGRKQWINGCIYSSYVKLLKSLAGSLQTRK